MMFYKFKSFSPAVFFILCFDLSIHAQSVSPVVPLHYKAQSAAEHKISPLVLNLIHEMRSLGYNAKNIPPDSYTSQRKTILYQIDRLTRIHVTIKCTESTETMADMVRDLGGVVSAENRRWAIIEAWMPYEKIISLAASEKIRNIQETERGHVRTGSINSEGDTLHNTLAVRQLIAVDGSGITVGVISDGCDNIAASQSTNDLPGSINVIDNSEGGDEGTAMLEIIHDLAPGAGLAFSEGFESSLEFINSVNDLVAAGCDIVVDDLGYFGEPWFEEGPIATAVREAIENDGIVYSSSAGNSQDQHYEGDFSGLGSRLALNDVHDFGNGDWTQSITIGGRTTIFIFIQWNDPFGSSANEYVLHLANADGSSLSGISSTQPDPDNPYAYLGAETRGPFSTDVTLIIERTSGSANRRVELEYNYSGTVSINEHFNLPGSINGQPAVSGVIATGAVRYNTPNLIEYFSSIGPSRIYSYPSYTYEDRLKPDLVAVDGNQITGAGGFGQEWPSGSGDIRFFGTSASAPHAAAGAAVVWSAYPQLTNIQVKQRLLDSAVDLGAGGFDFTFGYGRMDVQQACDSPPFTVSGINGGSDALISSGISAGDPLAELTGYVLTAAVSPFRAYLDKILFSLSGSATAGDFNNFSLYVDVNKDRQVSPATDSLLATEAYANPLVFDSLGYMFDNTGHQLILTADVASLADPDNILNVQLNDSSDIVAYFDVAASTANFPFVPADISLPVQFLGFHHEIKTGGVLLRWETASELNSLFFEIERQIKNEKLKIARIEAAGNTSAYQQYSYFDKEIIPGEEILYSLFLVETSGQRIRLAETAVLVQLPTDLSLLPNYPNPFNPETMLNFNLPAPARVSLTIFNATGQHITRLLNGNLEAGKHEILFDASAFPSGIYFAILQANDSNGKKSVRSQKLVLIK